MPQGLEPALMRFTSLSVFRSTTDTSLEGPFAVKRIFRQAIPLVPTDAFPPDGVQQFIAVRIEYGNRPCAPVAGHTACFHRVTISTRIGREPAGKVMVFSTFALTASMTFSSHTRFRRDESDCAGGQKRHAARTPVHV